MPARALQSLDEEARRQVSLERDEVGLLAQRVLREQLLVAQDGGGLALRQRHHLGDDHAFGHLAAIAHQLVGERLAAHEGNVAEDDVRPLRLHLVDELGGRLVRRHHHHRAHRMPAPQKCAHGLVHVAGVPLVTDAQDALRVAVVLAQHLRHAVEAGIAVAVLLGEDRDLVDRDPPDSHQIFHRGSRLLRIAGPVVEDVPIGRVAPQQAGAGERAEEEHLLLQRERHRHLGGGRADVADEAEHVAALRQILHHRPGALGLVAVVESDEAQLAAAHSAGIVRGGEGEIDARLHAPAELLGRSGEWRSHAKDNLGVRHALDGRPRACLGLALSRERRLPGGGRRRFLLRTPPHRSAHGRSGDGRAGEDDGEGGTALRRRRWLLLGNHDFLRPRGGRTGAFPRAVLRFVVRHHLVEEQLVARFPDGAFLGGDVQLDVELALAQAHRAADGVDAAHLAEARVDDLPILHEHDHVVLGTSRRNDGEGGRLPADVVELNQVGERGLRQISAQRHASSVRRARDESKFPNAGNVALGRGEWAAVGNLPTGARAAGAAFARETPAPSCSRISPVEADHSGECTSAYAFSAFRPAVR